MKAVNIAFACYPVTSLGKAREFYEKVLGLKATSVWVKNDSFGMVEYDIGPTTMAIGAGAETFKVGEGGASVALEVEDFDATVEELKGRGCKFLVEAMETPVCFMAVVADPDGNKITIHKRKPA
ncbi:MAG: VOC family protein [Candidatus Micrarchaeota archaeon]|nr:VOC family protein [Candidatus Micrarchaeota archaeon]